MWDQPEQRLLDRRDIRVAVDQLHAVPRALRCARGEHRARQCRRVEHVRGSLIDIVLNDLVVELDDADKRQVEAPQRSNGRGAEPRLRDLIWAVQPDRDDLTNTRAEQPRPKRGGDELVLAIRIGHTTLHGGGPINVEEQPVDAAHRVEARVEIRGPVRPQRRDTHADPALNVLHLRKVPDRVGERRGVARRRPRTAVDRHRDGRRVRARHERRERRLRSAADRDRRQRDTAKQPDQHHDRDVIAAATRERHPKPIARDSSRPSSHTRTSQPTRYSDPRSSSHTH